MIKKDLDILFLSSENARARINNIALAVKKSPQLVKYTQGMMKKEGLLFQPFAIIDYSYFGLLLFRVYFKGGYFSSQEKERILRHLRANQYVVAAYELEGEYDLVVEMCVPNPSRFHKELCRIVTEIPALNNYKVILNIVSHIYPKWYLLKNKSMVKDMWISIVIGGDRVPEQWDQRELGILHFLIEDPTLRLTTLAEKCHLNIKTVMMLWKGLQQRKVLRGFQYLLSHTHLGIIKERLFLKLHNLSEQREEQLMHFLLSTPEIVQVHKTIGDWTMEIDIESLDQLRLRKVIRDIREQFKDLIETFMMMEFGQYYYKSFLPKYAVEGNSGINNQGKEQRAQ